MDSPMANNLPHKMGPALGQKEKKSPIENRILGALRPRTENPFSIHAPVSYTHLTLPTIYSV